MASIVKSRVALTILASCAVATCVPAKAATITVNAQTASYNSDSPNGPFAYKAHAYDGDYASVGHINSGLNAAIDGYYASLIQFVLPTLPTKAVVKDVELTLGGFSGDRTGDLMMTVYSTQGTGFDPGNIGAGAKYGVIHPIDFRYTLDVTYVIGNQLATLPAGSTAGFSFQQIAENCTFLQINNTCFNILGGSAGTNYFIPTLEITYDEVTAAVPEPSTWAMMMIGFAGLGVMAYRKRERLLQAV